METAGIIIGALILVGLVFVVWITRPVRSAFDDPVPYKLEPIETSEPGKYPPLENANETTTSTTDDVAVPLENKKRGRPLGSRSGYIKRSRYWSTDKPAAKLRKARAAQKKKRNSK